MTLPRWLTYDTAAPNPLYSGKRINEGYIRNTLRDLRKAVLTLLIHENKRRCIFNTPVLALTALMFIIALSFANTLELLVLMAGILVVWARIVGVTLNRDLAKLWLAMPVFTAFISLPVMFKGITPGIPLTPWHDMFAITGSGLMTYSIFVLRVSLSTFVLFSLIACKDLNQLANLLYFVPVLKGFAFIVEITYRYARTLLLRAEDSFLAKRSRCVPINKPRKSRAWVIQETARFFADSSRYAEELYNVMVSRGFRGGFSGALKKDINEPWAWYDAALLICGSCVLLVMVSCYV